MVTKKDSTDLQENFPHPDELIPIFKAQLQRKNAFATLKLLHNVCKKHFLSGRRDFERTLIVKAAGVHYQTLRKPVYRELLSAWASYASQHPLAPAEGESLSPDEVYLIGLSSVRGDARPTLTRIHEACKAHFKAGKYDFSYIEISSKASIGEKSLSSNPAYLSLLKAWERFSELHVQNNSTGSTQTPEVALAKARMLCQHQKSKATAEKVYEVCKKLHEEGDIDFDYAKIASLCGLKTSTAFSKARYRMIVNAWHDATKEKMHGIALGVSDPYNEILANVIETHQLLWATRMKLEHIHTMLKVQHENGQPEFNAVNISKVTKVSTDTLTASHLPYKKLFDAWEKITGKQTFYTLETKDGRLFGTDDGFRYLLRIDPNLGPWQKYAVSWMSTLKQTHDAPLKALKLFFYNYLHKLGLSTNPEEFFKVGYKAPCFYKNCLSHLERTSSVVSTYNLVERFLNFVLVNFYSEEMPNGARIVPSRYCSPLPPLPESVARNHRGALDESNKKVLPYRLIVMLRTILCPESAKNFGDWTWAHSAVSVSGAGGGGDWFAVNPSLIDKDDPDCVHRIRTDEFGIDIHEMWCPARSVALMVKLELPLRMYQVRFLDSGEQDTYRYTNGEWSANSGPLAKGTSKRPHRMGVFRRMRSAIGKSVMTGLYISTNKSADRMKNELTRGYDIPWEHKKVLYWLERLRNWQEKYNPIEKPMPWSELDKGHFGSQKSLDQKLSGGETCFLFRNAAATGIDKQKPIKSGPAMVTIWVKLLLALEDHLSNIGETAANSKKLTFLNRDGRDLTPIYTLHGLRVSLITSFALEGGVPMPVLSKCIAGHARIVMTLYYTKAGVQYVTDAMQKASQKMFADSKENYMKWLLDASYEELVSRGAYIDPAAVQAVLSAQANGASLVMDDKGLCPKGAMGCDSGGIYRNEDNESISYGPVPGFPQKNCPRCRWFFTGPAFLDGLHNHWNIIMLQMGDNGEKVKELAERKSFLEDQRYESQSKNQLFLQDAEYRTIDKAYENAVSLNDKLAQDQHATLRLIDRCAALANMPAESAGLSLVGAGDISNVEFAIEECSKLKQLLAAVQVSSVYPEFDVSKAILETGRAYDRMLAQNGKPPVLFRLSDIEQRSVVQHMTILLRAHAGSTDGALDFLEGRRKLNELGFDFNETTILELARSEQPLLTLNFKGRNQKKGAKVVGKPKELENAG